MVTEETKLTFEQLMGWIDEEPERKAHHDVELLRYLGGEASQIWLLPPEKEATDWAPFTIRLILSEEPDDYADWNQWDSFIGWAPVADVLWARLQPHISKKVKVTKPAGSNGKKSKASKTKRSRR